MTPMLCEMHDYDHNQDLIQANTTHPLGNYKFDEEMDPMNPVVVCVIEVAFLLLIALLAVAGNIMNIGVIGSSKSLRNGQGYFLLSLAIADLGMGIVTSLAIAPATMLRWPYGMVMCEIIAYSSEVCTRVSLLMIICLSIERYIAVIHPFHYQRFITKKKILIVIIIIWVLCFGFFAIMFTSVGLGYEFDRDKLICSAAYEDNTEFYVIALAVLLLPSFVVITFTSVSVHVRVLQSSRRREILFGRSGSSSSDKPERLPIHFRKNMKSFKMLMIIAGVYYVTWLPYTILASLILTVICHKDISSIVEFLTFWLTVSNSGFNVFVYFVMNKKFRIRVKVIAKRIKNQFRSCCRERPTRISRKATFSVSRDRRYFIGIRKTNGEIVPTNVRIKSGNFSDEMLNDFGVIPTDQHIFSIRSLKKMRSEPMRKRSVGMPTLSLKMELRERGEQPHFQSTEITDLEV